ncbi:hypothetical protein PCL_11086 [Purpureocillium lilacinum]|uniref:Uncharacterized protein n=1 Tax=Purpureocillium lilacinum TaxID=33203 RepID=A0A2U3EDD8_PURLI|nr:hypothetical protein PCL_11086 [Purpureocillium lilacinum]
MPPRWAPAGWLGWLVRGDGGGGFHFAASIEPTPSNGPRNLHIHLHLHAAADAGSGAAAAVVAAALLLRRLLRPPPSQVHSHPPLPAACVIETLSSFSNPNPPQPPNCLSLLIPSPLRGVVPSPNSPGIETKLPATFRQPCQIPSFLPASRLATCLPCLACLCLPYPGLLLAPSAPPRIVDPALRQRHKLSYCSRSNPTAVAATSLSNTSPGPSKQSAATSASIYHRPIPIPVLGHSLARSLACFAARLHDDPVHRARQQAPHAPYHHHHYYYAANMGQSIIDRIQAKLELFRLEQRYTRRRHRRSTFVSNAIYVDGEYIYQTPNSTGSSTDSSATRVDALHGERAIAVSAAKHTAQMAANTTTVTTEIPTAERKRLNRFSSIPSFGGAFGGGNKDRPKVVERRTSMIR